MVSIQKKLDLFFFWWISAGSQSGSSIFAGVVFLVRVACGHVVLSMPTSSVPLWALIVFD